MFGYLGGMTLSMPRMVFALARDGFLPRALAAVHPVHRSPQAAIVAQSALTVALAISGTFEKLAILANASVLALYLGCALAAWRLRRMGIEGGGTGTAFRAPLAGLTPVAGVRRDPVAAHRAHGRRVAGICRVRRRGVDDLWCDARHAPRISGLIAATPCPGASSSPARGLC